MVNFNFAENRFLIKKWVSMNETNYVVKYVNRSNFLELNNFYQKYSSGGLARHTLQKWFDGEDPEGAPIFALDKDEIIGAGYVRICSNKFGLFTNWLIRPDWRKKGVASEMDKFAFGILNAQGINNAVLAVDTKNDNSLNRLIYLKNKKIVDLKDRGNVYFVYTDGNLSAPNFNAKVFCASENDESEIWWFIRLSLTYYSNHGLYGEDRNFHYLDRRHLTELIKNKRVFIARERFWVKGLVIINPESLIGDKSNKSIMEICFACGAFEPIIDFIFNQYRKIIRAYIFDAKNLRRFFKVGFLPNHINNSDFNMRTHKVFSYKIKK